MATNFIEAVRAGLEPTPRGNATANTLGQLLSQFTPSGIELADLATAWKLLAVPPHEGDEGPVLSRRTTCGELAAIASQFTTSEGHLGQAIVAWQAWHMAFEGSDDPRQKAMATTFERELHELEAKKDQPNLS
jgi:hypothetical protein